jgi:hypothetical protein
MRLAKRVLHCCRRSRTANRTLGHYTASELDLCGVVEEEEAEVKERGAHRRPERGQPQPVGPSQAGEEATEDQRQVQD